VSAGGAGDSASIVAGQGDAQVNCCCLDAPLQVVCERCMVPTLTNPYRTKHS
jgi:hypothetical protein